MIENAIQAQARSFEPGIEGYVSYVCKSSGKRIRPALALLTGGATGGVSDDHRKLGVILELVHIASLVHDDIMDGADLRRNLPTAAAKWGAARSSRAAVETGSPPSLQSKTRCAVSPSRRPPPLPSATVAWS